MQLGDWTDLWAIVASLLIAVGVTSFSWWQWRASIQRDQEMRDAAERRELGLRTASLLHQYTSYFYESGLVEVFAQLNYNQDLGFEETLVRAASERSESAAAARRQADLEMSRLLDFLNSVCLAVNNGALDIEAVQQTVLGYVIARVRLHKATREYLAWVDDENPSLGRQHQAFCFFREKGRTIAGRMYDKLTEERLADILSGKIAVARAGVKKTDRAIASDDSSGSQGR
jgi:hypothetical protein